MLHQWATQVPERRRYCCQVSDGQIEKHTHLLHLLFARCHHQDDSTPQGGPGQEIRHLLPEIIKAFEQASTVIYTK